jgi:hypothetical protein
MRSSILVLCLSATSSAFAPASVNRINKHASFPSSLLATADDTKMDITVSLPGSRGDLLANLKLNPVLSTKSTLVEVRYAVPFGLDVQPKKGLAVCTKDGPGGEQVNDVLRFTSQWSLGLPRGDGLITQGAAFAGGLSWQCSLFDVMKANSWEEVVEALTSNTLDRTDEVVLIFERSLEGTPPELE